MVGQVRVEVVGVGIICYFIGLYGDQLGQVMFQYFVVVVGYFGEVGYFGFECFGVVQYCVFVDGVNGWEIGFGIGVQCDGWCGFVVFLVYMVFLEQFVSL